MNSKAFLLASLLFISSPAHAGPDKRVIDRLYLAKERVQRMVNEAPYVYYAYISVNGWDHDFSDECGGGWLDYSDGPDVRSVRDSIKTFLEQRLEFIDDQIKRELAK